MMNGVVFADVAMIQRVIQDLIDKAIKYTPENREIELQINRHNETQLEFKVVNSGEEIKEEDCANVFDRYYKIDKQEKGILGSGLGLAIVKKIMEVQVSSEPGLFTAFSFVLPAVA